MTALSIQPPYPIFTEADGSPLENGFVYIGTANLDPVANPIAVYWDAAMTIPAAQPIRTLNGYPSRSGTPARMYVNSDYSIRVNDSKGVAVYSAPAATERVSNDVISSTEAIDGTWTPSITFATPGNLSIAYTTQTGRYTKIGNTVIAQIDLLTSSFTHTTASGAITVSLPLTANASNNAVGAGVFAGWTSAGRTPVLQVNPGAATASVRGLSSGATASTFGVTEYPTGATVRIQATISYRV